MLIRSHRATCKPFEVGVALAVFFLAVDRCCFRPPINRVGTTMERRDRRLLWLAVLANYWELVAYARRFVGSVGGATTIGADPRDVLHEAIRRQACASTPLADVSHALARIKLAIQSVGKDRRRVAGRRPTLGLPEALAGGETTAGAVELHDALEVLAGTSPSLAAFVERVLDTGETPTHVGRELGIPGSTARRMWSRAVTILRRHLR